MTAFGAALPRRAGALVRRAAARPQGFAARSALALLLVLLVAPFLPVVVWSVTRAWFYPAIVPQTLDLSAWTSVFSATSGVPAALGRSVLIALSATGLAMLFGVPAGRALALHRFPGRRLVEVLVLAPLVVPPLAVAMGLHAVFLKIGLAGTVPGVVLAHIIPTLPYVILVSASVFSAFDTGLEDQARSLGATPSQVLRHVTVPLLAPGLAVAALFAFLVSWSQYGLTLLVGSGRVPTMPLILMQFVTAGRQDVAGAIAVLTVLPGVLALVLSARILAAAAARERTTS
ncbi:ABC transporter permease [Chthonobacter rhizosphaerae]|uniref:ABC transporter permease n=1 Tax=Chthonobacter rhizosphaerae TaxID=2735553 RepID=UPI0015EEA74A|nr:ABC transporter permease subunit [Chthonobacter rhizosphaerae]